MISYSQLVRKVISADEYQNDKFQEEKIKTKLIKNRI